MDSIQIRLTSLLRSCCIIFIVPTTFLSFLFTVNVDYGETTFDFSFAEGILVLALLSVVLSFLACNTISLLLTSVSYEAFKRFLVCFTFFISLLWVFIANVQPDWDSRALVEAAHQFPEDTSSGWWCDGGYLERFPFQIFLIVIIHLFELLSGSSIVLFFEVINCIASSVSALLVIRLLEILTNSEEMRVTGILLCSSFLPLYLYSTFIYGNTLCLPFCLGAFALQLSGFQKNSLWRHFLSIPLAVTGVLIKSSMLLVIVAMAVVWVVAAIKRRAPLLFLTALCIVCFYQIANTGFLAAVQPLVHTDLSNPLPSSTWVVMGTGANNEEKTTYMAGMNNNYVWEILDDDYDPETYKQMNGQYLRERIDVFVNDPVFAVKYFLHKYVYEWCEPTFGSIGASNWTRGLSDEVMADRELTPLAHSLYYGKLNVIVRIVCDVSQSLVLLGASCYILLSSKNPHIETFAPFLYSAGGALFYLFWEAKSQYILPLYLVLIPYAAIGINLALDKLRYLFKEKSPTAN